MYLAYIGKYKTYLKNVRVNFWSDSINHIFQSAFLVRTYDLNLRKSLFIWYCAMHGKLPGMNLLKRRNEP